MRKSCILFAFALLISLFGTAQSLVGTWEVQEEIDDNGTPLFITLTPYFGDDGSMNLYCEMNMTLDALGEGTPEGELEVGFGTDVQGKWERNGNELTMNLDCDNIEVYGTNLMMPNMEVERANIIVEQFQQVIGSLQGELTEHFKTVVSAFNTTLIIVKLTEEELALDDGSDEPVTFQRADAGNYDPE